MKNYGEEWPYEFQIDRPTLSFYIQACSLYQPGFVDTRGLCIAQKADADINPPVI